MSKLTPERTSEDLKLSGNRALYCQFVAWLISVAVGGLAIIAWGRTYNWHFTPFSIYIFFPLLGLLAFSIMWTHYMASLLRQSLGLDKSVLHNFFEYTSWAVLVLICLHPGLLIYQRFHDGYGLPPHSYESYVAPGLGWITILGSVSLLIFLGYEFRRLYHDKSWWRYMQVATDLAMLGIFYHALRLGSQTRAGWYRGVWLFYGVTLVVALVYSYSQKLSGRPVAS